MSTPPVVWSLIRTTGAFRLGRRLRAGSLPALTYHRVRADGDWVNHRDRDPNVVSTSEFERHVAYLARQYHVLSGEEFRTFLNGRTELPLRSALITFDDGYLDNYTEAFPILRRHGVSAIFFVTTAFIGSTTSYLWLDRVDTVARTVGPPAVARWLDQNAIPVDGETIEEVRSGLKRLARGRRFEVVGLLESTFGRADVPQTDTSMSWEQLAEMADAGMTIGSHTATHQILGAATRDEVRDELFSSRAALEERLRRPCWAFSYPNGEVGDFRPEDAEDLRAAGYQCAFTQVPGFIAKGSNVYALPRVPVPGVPSFDVFLSRLSGVYAWLRSARATFGVV